MIPKRVALPTGIDPHTAATGRIVAHRHFVRDGSALREIEALLTLSHVGMTDKERRNS